MKKQRVISSNLIKYNANSRGTNTTDCVCRAISTAYAMKYNDVLKLLNKAQKKFGYTYKYLSVFGMVIHDLGAKVHIVSKDNNQSLDQFADAHNSGTYIVCVSKSVNGNPSHVACVIDGDVYDTWDSRNQYVVKQYWEVTATHTHDRFDMDKYREQLREVLYEASSNFCNKYCKKFEIPEDKIMFNGIRYNANVLNIILWYKSSVSNNKYDFSFSISYPIDTTIDDAILYTENICKTRLYDRFYNASKKDKEYEEVTNQEVKYRRPNDKMLHDSFEQSLSGRTKQLYNNLPTVIRPYVLSIEVDHLGQYHDSVMVECCPLPDDTYDGTIVRFTGYNFQMIKAMIKRYVDTFEQPVRDYDQYDDYAEMY